VAVSMSCMYNEGILKKTEGGPVLSPVEAAWYVEYVVRTGESGRSSLSSRVRLVCRGCCEERGGGQVFSPVEGAWYVDYVVRAGKSGRSSLSR